MGYHGNVTILFPWGVIKLRIFKSAAQRNTCMLSWRWCKVLLPIWDDDEEDDDPKGNRVKWQRKLSLHVHYRKNYGAPNISATCRGCPSLDKVIKGRLSAELGKVL